MRASVKEENPDLSAKDITIKLGVMWKEIKETDEVEKYNKMANLDKDRYKNEIENYTPEGNESEEEVKEEEEMEKPKKTENKKTENKKTESKKTESKKTESKKPVTKKSEKISNEDLVREIIQKCKSESITMKLIKDELKKKGVEIPKDELKEIIAKINEDEE
jgi:hypothetical protein